MSEVACLNWKHCVDTFLDLEKFYDSIDNVKLIQQAFQLKWNPGVLYMSLVMHMAPRVFRIGDLWGKWISPCNSILQGCGSSNSWARVCYTICYKTCTPVSLCRLVSRSTTSITKANEPSTKRITGQLRRHACWSGRASTSPRLTLSQNKSVVVASHPQLLRAVRRELLEQGISFEGTDSVRDVGLDANAGNKRSVKIQNKREQKCRNKKAHI